MGDVLDLVPDLAAPKKARKIRASKHDFKDGDGRVFAHRHANGNGWVADTAQVAESVFVSSGAQVYGNARVFDTVKITGKASVGDFARVMNRVKLSGNAIVRGSALLRDSVHLTGKALVTGQAYLSGNTFADGRVRIGDFAVVHNTRCTGPKFAYALEIWGNAKVFDSRLSGPSRVQDTAVLQGATLNYSCCQGSAKVFQSTVNTDIDADLMPWIHGYRRRRRSVLPDPSAAPSLDGRQVWIEGMVFNSHLSVRPCTINSGAYLINCSLSLYNMNMTQVFPEFPPGVLIDMQTNSLENLLARYRAPTAAEGPAIPMIAAVGVVPAFDQPRQRRIMRMEETQ